MDTVKTLKPGTVLHSPERDYVILKVLGQGGFGITYLVEGTVRVGNITAKINFAVKEHYISSLCERDSDSQRVSYSQPVAETVRKSLRSFLKEAQRLQALGVSHPNIIKINEVFEANNTAYYVMEYLEGETLQHYVNNRAKLSPQEAQRLMQPIAEAVGMLHENRLTHYDIKPENIIVVTESDGSLRTVLIDFGLSKHYDPEGNATSTIGMTGLTPGYAPIEQYSGLIEFTPEADVYALGATLYFCLTGEKPEEAGKFQVRKKLEDKNLRLPSNMKNGLIHSLEILKENRTKDAAMFVKETFQEASDVLEGPFIPGSKETKIDITPFVPEKEIVVLPSSRIESDSIQTPKSVSKASSSEELRNTSQRLEKNRNIITSILIVIIGLLIGYSMFSYSLRVRFLVGGGCLLIAFLLYIIQFIYGSQEKTLSEKMQSINLSFTLEKKKKKKRNLVTTGLISVTSCLFAGYSMLSHSFRIRFVLGAGCLLVVFLLWVIPFIYGNLDESLSEKTQSENTTFTRPKKKRNIVIMSLIIVTICFVLGGSLLSRSFCIRYLPLAGCLFILLIFYIIQFVYLGRDRSR